MKEDSVVLETEHFLKMVVSHLHHYTEPKNILKNIS